MPRLRPRSIVWLSCALGATLAGVFATTGSGSHGPQEWAGQWHFTHTSGPTSGVTGGFAFRHETDENGAELLQLIGGLACEEPTDYFAGAYTVPDTEDLGLMEPYVDTGKFRGCTVGDPKHLRGRYQSNYDSAVAGDFELVLSETDDERWTGTFTVDGSLEEYTWIGFFQVHFADGAEDVSDPPYEQEPPPVEPPPPGTEPPGPEPQPTETCNGKAATITPNPDAPPGFAITGTTSDDVIVGTAGDDRILGLGGNDTICAFGGDDEIVGADGDDYIVAGLGNDTVHGDAGEDTIAGDYSDFELLSPNGGNDQLFGGDGKDWLEAGPGNDTIFAGAGDDDLYGNILQGRLPKPEHPESAVVGPDNDQMSGEAGRDTFYAGRGNDKLDGGAGDDHLDDGAGADIVNGGAGTDRFEASGGNDRIDGGEGGERKRGDLFGDEISYFQAPKAITLNLTNGKVTGSMGRDVVRNVESVQATNYADVLKGSSGPDWLAGWGGDDDIYGLGGADTLFGGSQDDLLIGGKGSDVAFGGPEFDICAAERRAGCERLRPGVG